MPGVALQHGQSPGGRRGNALAFPFTRRPGLPRNGCTEIKGATRSISMMDILMLALGFGFFALAIGYTYACERL
jgi:hypothetical protein